MQKIVNAMDIAVPFDFNRSVTGQILQILKKIGLPLFVVTILGTTADQWVTLKLEDQLMAPDGTGPLIWWFGSLSIILNLIYPMVTLLISLSAMSSEKITLFLKQHGNQTLIEQMRAWGKSMLWSLLFILPGLIQFFRFVFVPFIVCFDPEYKNGTIDALEKSKTLSKGKLLPIVGLFALFAVALPALLTAVDDYKVLWKTPLGALAICFIEMTLNFCFIWILWRMYQKQKVVV